MSMIDLFHVFFRLRHSILVLVLASLFGPLATLVQGETEVDVMVLYTAGVRDYHGGSEGVTAHVHALVAGANLGLGDSGIEGRFRLAHIAQVDYLESGSMESDLVVMRGSMVEAFADLPALRDEFGADLVCLLRKGGAEGVSGIAYVMNNPAGNSAYGFSVVATEYASMTFLHELAHNLGAGHARADEFNGIPTAGGLYEWSHGFRFEGTDEGLYRTIMAYAPGSWLMRFSNPDQNYQGAPLGRSMPAAEAADNARTLREVFPVVESYRHETMPVPVIQVQPANQEIRYGEAARFEVRARDASDFQWYEGMSGDTSRPVTFAADGASSSKLTVHARIDESSYWVRVGNESGHVDSQAAQLDVVPRVGAMPDQFRGPGEEEPWTFGNQEHFFDIFPQWNHLSHIMLPFDVRGYPDFPLVVALMTEDRSEELVRVELQPEDVAGEEWDRIPLNYPVVPDQAYQIRIDLGLPGADGNYELMMKAPTAEMPGGGDSWRAAEFCYATYGYSTNWYTFIDPQSATISDYRESYLVDIAANVFLDPVIPYDWINAYRIDELEMGQMRVEVEPYDAAEGFFGPRSGYLIIGDEIHRVTQEAIVPSVSFAPQEGVVSAGGGIHEVGVSSNFRWTAIFGGVDWASLEDPTGAGDTTLRIDVDANPGAEPRSATLTIYGNEYVLVQAGSDDSGDPDNGLMPEDLVMGAAAFARYNGIGGSDLADLYAAAAFPDSPDSVQEFGSFEMPDSGENFGLYAWAWLVPEVSGNYTFWIASDDEGVLSLSPGADSEAAAVIARVPAHSGSRQYDKYPEQQSSAVFLEAGEAYYLEAQMKQGWSDTNLSVAWQGPGFSREVVPGRVLGLPGEPAGDGSEEGPVENVERTDTVNLAHFAEIPGSTLESLYGSGHFPDSPDLVEELSSFTYQGSGDNFGLFAWGWIVPETSGDYTFWLSSDDQGELLLSENGDAGGAARIATVSGYTGYQQFDWVPEQQSEPVSLEAGTAYYLAAAAKQEWGGSHVSVAWAGPGLPREIIPGAVLTASEPAGTDDSGTGDSLVTGGMAVARYDGAVGSTLDLLWADPAFPASPDEVGVFPQFDYPGGGYNFGLLAWAWLVPEVSGTYRFWLASDDQGELRLSPDASPGNAAVIASVATHTNPHQYEKMSSQASAIIELEAGQAYYIEAICRQGWGGSHLSVAWEGPGFAREVIPGRVLALPEGDNPSPANNARQ